MPACRELGIGIVPYSPLGRGLLTGTISATTDLADDDFRRRAQPRFHGRQPRAQPRASSTSSRRSPPATAARPARSPWPGCSPRATTWCRSRAPGAAVTWRRTSRRRRSPSTRPTSPARRARAGRRPLRRPGRGRRRLPRAFRLARPATGAMAPAVDDGATVGADQPGPAGRIAAFVTGAPARGGRAGGSRRSQSGQSSGRPSRLRPTVRVEHPLAKLERRAVANVLVMATRQLGHPVTDVVSVVAGDRLFHDPSVPTDPAARSADRRPR